MDVEYEGIDMSCLTKNEQKSRMYRNILTVFSMCENKPLTYEEVNDYLSSLYLKYTGAKTTCVYWRQTLMKEGTSVKCTDPECQEKQPHRICGKAIYRKTKVIWVQRDLARKMFKLAQGRGEIPTTIAKFAKLNAIETM